MGIHQLTNQGRATSPQTLYTMDKIETIKAEVKRRIQQIKDAIEKESDAEMETYFSGKVIALEEFEFFISTLEKECEKPTPADGLEEEINRFHDEVMPGALFSKLSYVARHFALWMRDKMLKEAVEKKGVVWDDEFVKFDDGTFLDFRDPTLSNNPAFVLPKNGEKVKVIVIKED